MKKPQFTREQIQFYILQFRKVDTNTLEGRRRLIDGFVNSVVVYDDYILVTFNYKEGAERITFEQIERSDLSSLGDQNKRQLRKQLPFVFSFQNANSPVCRSGGVDSACLLHDSHFKILTLTIPSKRQKLELNAPSG